MKARIYVETTIFSYLTAKPSRDLVIAAHQQITQEWWEARRHTFDLFISELVIREAGAGNEDAAQKRLEALKETEGDRSPRIERRGTVFGRRTCTKRSHT